jgi:poly(3-hydroxybutyrate) depolymerase
MGTPAPSMGCGTTATLTFGTVPGEMANATSGSPNLGTGKGGWVTITSGGQARNFAIRLPDNYDNNHPYRLIFAFHGNGENAAGMDSGGAMGISRPIGDCRESRRTVRSSSRRNGTVAGGPRATSRSPMTSVKTISTNYCVDMSAIVTSDFSFGGGMSHALACSRASPRTNTAGYASERPCYSKRAAVSSMEAAQTTTPSRSGKRPA